MLILQCFINQTVSVQPYSCVQNTGARDYKEVCKPGLKMKKGKQYKTFTNLKINSHEKTPEP